MHASKVLTIGVVLGAAACALVSCGGDVKGGSSATTGSVSLTCSHMLPCYNVDQVAQTECETDLGEGRSFAESIGCGGSFDAILRCDAERPGGCVDQETGYEFSEGCTPLVNEFQDCVDQAEPVPTPVEPTTCSGGGGSCAQPPCPNTCFVECANFAATCEQWPGDIARCSCTAGPRTGSTFTISMCSDVSDFAEGECS